MYLSTCTRPDISYAVGLVARFTENPGPKHWVAVKQIFRYLCGNPTLGIVYSKTLAGPVFDVMVDADHTGNTKDRKSTNGYIFKMSGAPIVWISKKQQSVLIPSTEAEYMGLSACAREAIWLRALFSELSFAQPNGTTIRGDNKGLLMLAAHPSNHQRTKHINIHYHFTRERVATKEIILEWISMEDMTADVLTKGLGSVKHK